MAVGPSDVNTRTTRNVNLDICWLFARVEGSGHLATCSGFLFSVAAVTRGNGVAVRAGFRMAEERADARVELRADDVLETAGLRVSFSFVDGKSVLEQALRQAMAAHHVARPLASHRSQLRLAILQRDQMQIHHPGKNPGRRLFLRGRCATRRSRGV